MLSPYVRVEPEASLRRIATVTVAKQWCTPERATTALRRACTSLDFEIASAALSSGANANALHRGRTALADFIRAWTTSGEAGDPSPFLNLLVSHGASLDDLGTRSEPALLQCAGESQGTMRKALLGLGASVHVRGAMKRTPLQVAVMARCVPAIEDFLDAGSDVIAVDAMGQSVLHYLVSGVAAVQPPSIDDTRACALVLLNAGADPTLKDPAGFAPRDWPTEHVHGQPFQEALAAYEKTRLSQRLPEATHSANDARRRL